MSELTSIDGGVVAGRRRRRCIAVYIVAAAFLLCVSAFAAGFALFAYHVAQLEAPSSLHEADGIVALTGGQSRIDAALDLLKAGKGKRLLISGVNPAARVDDLRTATGSERSLFSCCVDIDRVALNTVGNAQESAKWMNSNTYGSLIVVTNNYHMPRSLLEMRRILPHAELHAYPVVNAPLTGGAWMSDPDTLRVLATEFVKYLAAVARGLVPWQQSGTGLQSLPASVAHK